MIETEVYRRRLQRSTRLLAIAVLTFAAALHAAALPDVAFQSTAGRLRLALVGDPGAGTAAIAKGLAVLNAGQRIDAILILGDNVYPSGVTSTSDPGWSALEPLSALGIPLYAVLGNHDYYSEPDAEVRATGIFPQWHMPARQYVIRSDVADLAMIDTTPYATTSSRDAETFVAAAFAASAAPWRIVVGHHTIVSSGWHGLFPRGQARKMRELLPALRNANVALYICGHDHHLELLDGYPRFLVSGAASEPIPPVNMHDDTIYPQRAHLREPKGFAVVEITPELLRVRFHRADGRQLSDWIDVTRQ